jgi:hypothetical protein
MEAETPDLVVSNVQFTGLEPEADSLCIRWTVEEKDAGRAAGQRLLLHLDPWRRRASYFGKEIDRDALTFPYRVEREIEIAVPQEWSIEESPANVVFSNEVGAAERTITHAAGVLHYRRLEINRVASTPPNLEAALREWDAAGYRADQQSVVLRKTQ